MTFYLRSQSPAALGDFALSVVDAAGLTRFQLAPGPSTLAPMAQVSLVAFARP